MKHIHAYIFGIIEFRSSFTTHYDDDAMAESYDRGRDMAHRLTLRHFEE